MHGDFFYGSGRAITKGGDRELGGTRVLRGGTTTKASSDIPLVVAGAAGRLPALSQLGIAIYPYSSRSCRTAVSPILTSIAIER